MLSGELEQAKKDIEGLKLAVAEAKGEAQVRKSIIRDAEMAIHLHQQDIQNWMAVAEVYQTSSIQSSDALGKIIAFVQEVTHEVPALSSKWARLI